MSNIRKKRKRKFHVNYTKGTKEVRQFKVEKETEVLLRKYGVMILLSFCINTQFN